jgi:hypothetical protein
MVMRQKLIFFRFRNFLISLCCLVLLIACIPSGAIDIETNPIISLDPIFRAYYENFGGEKLLGPAISPTFAIDGKKAQFLENALIYYDPDQKDGRYISFYPIGIDLGILEEGVNLPVKLREGSLFLNNHVIPPEFSDFYLKLGGQMVVGLPLTEVNYSPTYRRYEQYFENLGFFRLENAPKDEVHLLAYGSWFCQIGCNKGGDRNSIVDIQSPLISPFLEVVHKTGIDFTGYLLEYQSLTPGELAIDIAVFKNIVMEIDQANGNVQFVNLPEQVGIVRGVMSKRSNDTDMVFIPVLNETTGFNVHKELNLFIENLGGYKTTGVPIGEYHEYGRFFRQCFEYVCLLLDPEADSWLKVRPEPLGYTYLRMYQRTQSHVEKSEIPRENATWHGSQSENEFIMDVWEAHSSVKTDQSQSIYVRIYDKEMNPVPGLEPSLTLTIQGQGDIKLKLPPTDQNGETNMQLPVFVAPNGTLVPYKVCIETQTSLECREESYAIWNNP